MIDKLTPRFLDKSTDEKLVQKTSFVDALNVYVDGDLDSESAGVIKSIKGNSPIAFASDELSLDGDQGSWYCLGSTVDQNTGIVYFFMVGEGRGNHGVFAYDHRGVLPSKVRDDDGNITGFDTPTPGKLRRIIVSNDFAFPSKGFVKGDVVYTNTSTFREYDQNGPEKDVLLYFTDNKNEPRKVNVYRAYFTDGFSSEDRQPRRDQINACPRVPLGKVTFTFVNDESLSVNNFAASPGFQFAYQNIYKDGLESAISPYSDIAFPPSIVNRGAANKDNILAHNKCVLTIPRQNVEVESVRLLARYGNGANFIEIDEIPNVDPGNDITFDFLNDRVPGGVSKQTTDKTFDNLPRRAESQTVVSSRLVYGNYVEGFDNVDCKGVELEPVYTDRPAEILEYTVDVSPSIEMVDPDGLVPSAQRNKTIGFKIDSDQFADQISANTQISVSLKFSPDNNFHLYDVSNITPSGGSSGFDFSSYHQSRHVGDQSKNLTGYKTEGVVDQSPAFFQDQNYQSEEHAGGKFLQKFNENYFGFNRGVGGGGTGSNSPTEDLTYWRNVLDQGDLGEYSLDANQNRPIVYGTSAGNPLVLQGGTLIFKTSFRVLETIEGGGGQLIVSVINGLLEGLTIEEVASEYGFSDDLVEVLEVKRTHDHEISLGLEDYTSIPVNSGLGNLICGAGVLFNNSQSISDKLQDKPPSCAFIVNKATVRFYLERSAPKRFRICISKVVVDDSDGVMTCVRDLDPKSPWWAISKDTLNSPSFQANFNSIWQNNLRVSSKVFLEVPVGTTGGGVFRNFSSVFSKGYEVDEDTSAFTTVHSSKPVMEACFGFLEVGVDDDGERNLLRFAADSTGSAQNFRYSLMDGEGGPGGVGSEGDAYDFVGADRYGTIAGQVFVGYDQDAISKVAEYPGGDQDGLSSAQAYCGVDETGDVMGQQRGLLLIANDNVAEDLGIIDSDPIDDLGYRHTTVLMGPYYTGKIVLNNLTASAENASSAYVNPSGTTISDSWTPITTCPQIWYSSWTKYSNNASVESDPLIVAGGMAASDLNAEPTNGDYSDHQVSYPYPIVIPGTGGFDGEGGLTSGEIEQDPFGTGFNSVDFERLHSHCELSNAVTNYEPSTFVGGTSFKSGASHDFGIIYYDERGRHGYVNPVGSVYVETLGGRTGPNTKGAAFIKASNITHTPPPWAKTYKFAYSKNTSIDRFIQYNAGGAFVANADYEGGNSSEIYVSLNYLQGHPISYSNSFGAKGEDGTPVMYSFTPGDRLRVLSYMTSMDGANISRVYPNNIEFEVTGVTQFDDTASNPFAETDDAGDTVVTEAQKGLFLVLKNNIDAQGFRLQDVEQGNDNWGSNCIFEIYSPKKEVDEDARLYYEVGAAYPIVSVPTEGQSVLTHANAEVLLTQGDVFFRRHAVNLRESQGGEGFVDLLTPVDNDEEVVAPEANFKSYYLESEAATDLFPSRAVSIGRPNIVKTDARESNREASLIHSDRDVVESSKVGYSSFNRTIPSDMEIDFKAGPIHYLCNHQDSLFFVQNNKCGHIPVDRTLISDVAGSQSLIASSKFLGTPRYYAGDAGCDGDPSSVVNVDTTAYFVNKSVGKVYKVHPANGVNVISDAGMAGFFREELANAVSQGKRIIGGYDPQKKEYLLSIVDESTVISGVLPSEDVDEGFVASTVDVTSGGEIVDITAFEDPTDEFFEPDQEVEAVHSVRFFWQPSLDLDEASWKMVYRDGTVAEDFSTFKTKNTTSGYLLGNLVIRVENPHLSAKAIDRYDVTLATPEFDGFVTTSEADDQKAESIFGPQVDNPDSLFSWKGSNFVESVSGGPLTNVFSNTPAPIFLSLPNTSSPKLELDVNIYRSGVNGQADFEDGDVYEEVVPIQFPIDINSPDDLQTYNDLFVGVVLASWNSTISVSAEAGSQFRTNALSPLHDEYQQDMFGTVSILGDVETENEYNNIGELPVTIEVLGESVNWPICHPEIGLWQLLPPSYFDAGGTISQETYSELELLFDLLIWWQDRGQAVYEYFPNLATFESLSEQEAAQAIADIRNALVEAINGGQIASFTCPNIDYSKISWVSQDGLQPPWPAAWPRYDDWLSEYINEQP